MTTLWQDIRYGLRMLRKSPGFTMVAVLTLAIGIGANVAMFSVVNAVLLRPLPFENPDRLVVVRQHGRRHGWTSGFSYPDFRDWQGQEGVFSAYAAYTPVQFDLADAEGASQIDGAAVSSNFFSLLGTRAHLGRTFAAADERPDLGPVALLSHEFWQRRFGGDKDVVGRTVTLQDKVYSILGVLPPGFVYPEVVRDAQVWTVLAPTGDRLTNRSFCWLSTVGRLKPGVSLEQARERQNQWTQAREDGDTEILMSGLHDTVVRGVRATLWILSAIVGFILLIVCANVVNLCLARMSARDKEMAIRGALGADRRRLLRQCLTESLLLSLAGGVTGVILAVWMVAVFRVRIAGFVPLSGSIRINPRELLFGLAVSLIVGVLLGLVPFWVMQRRGSAHVLAERRGPSRHHARLSNGIVGAQIAVAIVLSIGTVLMVRSILGLASADTGFSRENLVTFDIGVRGMGQPQRYQLSRDLLERLRALPYVKAASTDSSMPCSPRASKAPVAADGYQAPDDKPVRACMHNVGPDYFETLQIPVRMGRIISLAEHEKKEPVVVINEGLARRFWPDQDPIGRMLDCCGVRYQVIGVVADMVQGNVKIDKPNHLFFPFDKVWPGPELKVVVRSVSDPGLVIQQAQAVLRQIDATRPLYGATTFKARMDECIGQERFTTAFLTAFASIALVLILIGIYGVVSYAAAQRTREIGIRMALGAQRAGILTMILRQGLILAIVGSLIGVAGAVGMTRFLAGYLYGISATDPVTFVLVPALITAVSLLAAWLPAHRATRVDPMAALRCE